MEKNETEKENQECWGLEREVTLLNRTIREHLTRESNLEIKI